MNNQLPSINHWTRKNKVQFPFISGILLSIALLILMVSVVLAAVGDLIWQDQFDLAGGRDSANAVALHRNQLFVAGSGTNAIGNSDWVVRAYEIEDGSLLWKNQLDLAGGFDVSNDIVVHRGRVFVSGFATNVTGNRDWLVLAYDAEDGDILWRDQFDLAGSADFAGGIVAQGSRVFVSGFGLNSAGDNDAMVRAYDIRNGKILWHNQFDLAGGSDATSNIAVQGSQVFVAGWGTNSAGDRDWLVRVLNTEDGSLHWQDQFDLAGDSDSIGSIAVQGRKLFVSGSGVNSAGDSDGLVRAYDTKNGGLLWQYQSDILGEVDDALTIAVEGRQVFFTGLRLISEEDSNFDLLVRALNVLDGSLLWEDQFDLAGGADFDSAIAVQRGQVYIAGVATNSAGDYDWLVRIYDSQDGSLLWQDIFDLYGGFDLPADIVVNSRQVFVVGQGVNTSGNVDWLVRAYNAR